MLHPMLHDKGKMCGIVGAVGLPDVTKFLLAGLKRLEYRGYDSAGLAILNNGKVMLQRAVGKLTALDPLAQQLPPATTGIAHTRWATHGEPSVRNAHPHLDASGCIAVVHNGIIENYRALTTMLAHEGVVMASATDSEVLPHLIAHFMRAAGADPNTNRDPAVFEVAVRTALREVTGAYGLVAIQAGLPDFMVAARLGSPLVIGLGAEGNMVASDTNALLEQTSQVIYLEDRDVASLTPHAYHLVKLDATPVERRVAVLEQKLEAIELGQFQHYMLKEIHEQPQTVRNVLAGRLLAEEGDIHLGCIASYPGRLLNTRRVILTACGTAWHAALIGKRFLADFADLPADVEYASEFRYANPIIMPETDLLVVISQSGETADTLAALREGRRRGATTLGICNVVGSTIAREVAGGIYTHAGPEIGVASTKAFTSQVISLLLLALYLGRGRRRSAEEVAKVIDKLRALPEQIEIILGQTEKIREIALHVAQSRNCLYMGRGYNYPIALEGALKLKEISYIHAEGYPAAEMKHGPIALIDENMPVVVIAPQDRVYSKIISNIEEIRARGGMVVAVASEGDDNITRLAKHVISIPHTLDSLLPALAVIPLQLLAYYIAVARGCDVDKPRNLAKSVTVE